MVLGVIVLARQMSGAYSDVLDGTLKGPTDLLGGGTVAHMMVLVRVLMLEGLGPIGRERFGRVVHVRFVGDLIFENNVGFFGFLFLAITRGK